MQKNEIRAIPVEISWHTDLSIYASEPFLKSVGDEYGWIGGIDNSGEILCILPYTIIRKSIIRMVRFRVETIPMGRGLDAEEEKSFLNSVIDFCRKIRADMIIPATTNAIFRTYPDGAIAAPYGTYIIDLSTPEENLWGNLNSSHRRKVRLAIKEGVVIRSGIEFIETAYCLVRDTFKRSHIPFMSYHAFRRMLDSLGKNVKIYVAESQGEMHGCSVVPFSNHTAYYLYGGSIPEPATGATNLMHWEAIRQFHSLGVRRYDFSGVRINPQPGSKQEGLMMYKQRFGPHLLKGYMWKYSIRPLQYMVYSLAIRLLRGGDIVDQECHKLTNT